MEPNETTLVEQLALLNDVEGVSNAIDSKYDGPILNNMTVTYYVAQSGGSKARRRIPCSGDRPNKLACALEAKRRVRVELGDAVVDAAEQRMKERRAAEASSSTELPKNAFTMLGATQQLQAALRAAEVRAVSAEQAATRAEEQASLAYAEAVREPLAAREAAWLAHEEAKQALARHRKQQNRHPKSTRWSPR